MRYEYDTQVNKGDINMRSLKSDLNKGAPTAGGSARPSRRTATPS